MVTRNIPGRAITEKNPHKGPPDLNVEQARALLGYGTKESVYVKARKGSKNGGFDAYVWTLNENGDGYAWKKKVGSGFESSQVMFYSQELKAWNEKHPAIDRAATEYTEEEATEVIALAESLREDKPYVSRARVYNELCAAGWKRKHTNYAKMAQILNDAGIPGRHVVKTTRANIHRGRKQKAS